MPCHRHAAEIGWSPCPPTLASPHSRRLFHGCRSFCTCLCDLAAFEEHAQQLQQDAQLCRSLTGLLIEAHWTSVEVLQELVARSDAPDAAADWVIAAELAAALASPMLHPGAESLACAAGRGDRGAAHSLASQLEASAQMLHLATTAGTAEELGPGRSAALHGSWAARHGTATRVCGCARRPSQACHL